MNFIGFDASSKFLKRKFFKKKRQRETRGRRRQNSGELRRRAAAIFKQTQRGQGRGKGRMNGAAARRHSFPFLDDVASAPATPRASKSKVKNPLPAHRTGNVGQHFRHFSTEGDDDDDGNE